MLSDMNNVIFVEEVSCDIEQGKYAGIVLWDIYRYTSLCRYTVYAVKNIAILWTEVEQDTVK